MSDYEKARDRAADYLRENVVSQDARAISYALLALAAAWGEL